ncbi:MAG: hypothetical protein R6V67_11940 [Spirochaetia bacterium]
MLSLSLGRLIRCCAPPDAEVLARVAGRRTLERKIIEERKATRAETGKTAEILSQKPAKIALPEASIDTIFVSVQGGTSRITTTI